MSSSSAPAAMASPPLIISPKTTASRTSPSWRKGWLGGGNTGRNTQVTRSNYFWPQSAAFFERSLKLYENLSRELNFNVMLSQRGILTLAHSPP